MKTPALSLVSIAALVGCATPPPALPQTAAPLEISIYKHSSDLKRKDADRLYFMVEIANTSSTPQCIDYADTTENLAYSFLLTDENGQLRPELEVIEGPERSAVPIASSAIGVAAIPPGKIARVFVDLTARYNLQSHERYTLNLAIMAVDCVKYLEQPELQWLLSARHLKIAFRDYNYTSIDQGVPEGFLTAFDEDFSSYGAIVWMKQHEFGVCEDRNCGMD